MLKQSISDEKDAIEKRLKALRDFYDKQKELLQDAYDEDKYLEEQAEKRKAVTDLEMQLAQLEYDNSAWAQKKKLELAEELAKAQKDLDDFEKEHALEAAKDQLDKLYELQEDSLNAQTEALEAKENDAKALYEQALEDIRNGSVKLYNEMIEWNDVYGDGIASTITSAWEEAYRALQEYRDLYGKPYDNVNLANATGYSGNKDSWDTAVVSDKGTSVKAVAKTPATSSSSTATAAKTTTTAASKPATTSTSTAKTTASTGTPTKGSSVTVKTTATKFSDGTWMASFVPGGKYTVYSVSSNGKEVLIGRNGVYTGWVNKTDLVGYASGTRKAVAGLHGIDELGTETIFQSADGSKYKLFTGGEKVLSAHASNFLYDFANSGGQILVNMLRNIFSGQRGLSLQGAGEYGNIDMGDIIIQGNADKSTVSEIRRAQRNSLDELLRKLNKLDK